MVVEPTPEELRDHIETSAAARPPPSAEEEEEEDGDEQAAWQKRKRLVKSKTRALGILARSSAEGKVYPVVADEACQDATGATAWRRTRPPSPKMDDA